MALPVETVDTTALAPADRFPYWLEMAERISARINFTSEYVDDFRGRAQLIDLGGVAVTRFAYQSLIGRRTPKLIRQADPELYQVVLAVRGSCALSARRRDTTIPVGDFSIIDWGRPHDLLHEQEPEQSAASSITVLIPRARLPLSIDRVDALTAVRMPGSEGPGALLAQHLRHILEHPEQFTAADAPHLTDLTLTLISMMLTRHLDGEQDLPPDVRQQAMVVRIHAFIDRQLGNPALGPQLVADAHHVSLRSLHRLFQGQSDTVAGTIRHRRLTRCHRDLADPRLRHQPVHLVARRWGFTDRAHFSRAFHATYGMSPQAWRAMSADAARIVNTEASMVNKVGAD